MTKVKQMNENRNQRSRGRNSNNRNNQQRGGRNNGGNRGGKGQPRNPNQVKQLLDKYLSQAREMAQSGDRVAAEGISQHAEHYQRLYNELQAGKQEKQQANQINNKHAKADDENSEAEAKPVDQAELKENSDAKTDDKIEDRPKAEVKEKPKAKPKAKPKSKPEDKSEGVAAE